MLFVILFALLFGILSLLGLRKLALKIGRGYLIVVGILFLIGFLVTMFNLLKQGDTTAFLIGFIAVGGIIVISLISAKRSDQQEKPIGFCPKCGESVIKSNKFCPRCGTEVKTLDTAADKATISILRTWGKTSIIGISFLLILVLFALLLNLVPAGVPFFGASIPTSQVVPPTLIPATKVPTLSIEAPYVLTPLPTLQFTATSEPDTIWDCTYPWIVTNSRKQCPPVQIEFGVKIGQILGVSSRNTPRLTHIIFGTLNGQRGIRIDWIINRKATGVLFKFGVEDDATNILKAVVKSGIDYDFVVLQGTFPVINLSTGLDYDPETGSFFESPMIACGFIKRTVDEINWGTFSNNNIFHIANETTGWSDDLNNDNDRNNDNYIIQVSGYYYSNGKYYPIGPQPARATLVCDWKCEEKQWEKDNQSQWNTPIPPVQ